MRTAMLATCEAQLETLQAELAEKEGTCREAIERVTSLQTALAGTEARLAERVKEAAAGTGCCCVVGVLGCCMCMYTRADTNFAPRGNTFVTPAPILM
jgi:DNA repair exonuclease SbcCD ATPase subunit